MATPLCLSPQTKSIILSIIPAGQGPARQNEGLLDAPAPPRLLPAGRDPPLSPAVPKLPQPPALPLPGCPARPCHRAGGAAGMCQDGLGQLVACPHPKSSQISTSTSSCGQAGRAGRPARGRELSQRSRAAHRALGPRRDNGRRKTSRGNRLALQQIPEPGDRPWPPAWHGLKAPWGRRVLGMAAVTAPGRVRVIFRGEEREVLMQR